MGEAPPLFSINPAFIMQAYVTLLPLIVILMVIFTAPHSEGYSVSNIFPHSPPPQASRSEFYCSTKKKITPMYTHYYYFIYIWFYKALNVVSPYEGTGSEESK